MTHTMWDLVPHIILHKNLSSGAYHADPGCDVLKTDPTYTKVTLKEVMAAKNSDLTCGAGCNQTLQDGRVWVLSVLLSAGDLLRSPIGKRTADQVRALDRARSALQALEDLGQPRVPNLIVEEGIEQVAKALEGLIEVATARMRTQGWRDELTQETQEDETEAIPGKVLIKYHPGALLTDMGMLVGSKDHNRVTYNTYLEILNETGEHPNKMVIMPMSALLYLSGTSGQSRQGGQGAGLACQVMPLPQGLTPELKELIVGLFAPDEDGPMNDLRDVVIAARHILSQT